MFICFLPGSGVSWSQWLHPLLNFVKDFCEVSRFFPQVMLSVLFNTKGKTHKYKHRREDRLTRQQAQIQIHKTDRQERQKTGRENKLENWMGLTLCQMTPKRMFINGVYSKWHCTLMLTLSWLLMHSLWLPTWEISNALNIHTLLCMWGPFNGSVKDFGVSSVRRCSELIRGRSGRSLGRGMNFRCSQSPKLTGAWKCPTSSTCSGGVVPRKKESWASQAGTDLCPESSPWAPAFIPCFSFFVKTHLTRLQLPSQGKSMTFTGASQHASLPFHFPFLTEVYAHPGSTVGPWIFFPLSQKKWSSEKKLQAFTAISTFTSALNGWTAYLCWVDFYCQLDIPSSNWQRGNRNWRNASDCPIVNSSRDCSWLMIDAALSVGRWAKVVQKAT